MCEGDGIRWQTLVGPNPTDVLTLPFEEAQRSLSYQTYWETYGLQHSAGVQAQLREQLKDWSADIALQDRTLTIICCPEDKECWRRCPKHKICENCRAPVCHYCRQDLKRQKQTPTLALANDMLIFYPPRQIYSKEVTFMELVCASPCFTAMACFSLEKKLLGDRALDQDAFMPRNRLVARGNATTFPLAWEELLQSMQEAAEQAHEGTLRLPKVGADLSAVMSVIIKAGGPNSNLADSASIIHQARVRRTIVLELLADAKAREHPAYIQVNMEDAVSRAHQLPEDGVPEELIALLPYDDDLDNVQRQKAATPVRNMLVPAEVQEEFAHMTAAGQGDENAQHAAALHAIAAGSQHAMHRADDAIVIHTGNRLLDQFEPWYFAFAFAFLFPYGTGMPDPPAWSTKPRYRRPPDAPQVDLSAWMRCMARRCEAQVNRDWTFGFTTWNLFFRSSINLARTIAPYDTPVFDEAQGKFCALTSVDIEAGAVQLVKALDGTYCDSRGKMRAVKGDVSRLPYVKNLRPAARKLLQNMRHTARAVPGTQEARRQMRFEISAMRIRYGVPLFITVSPDEAHQWLFVRMARTRASDPVRNAFPCQEWTSGDRDFPPLDDDILFPIHVERLRWQQRRRLLARDPLASVDGFHVLLRLLLRHMFGLHICELCPNCNETQCPCIDRAGSSATLLGGTFGRVDALYVTLEAQKSTGSLHGHIQCFVQCLHQHTPLTEIFQLSETKLAALREEYCRYQAHVAHSVYAGQTDEEIQNGIEASERAWPEHEQDDRMTWFPAYQLQRSSATPDEEEALAWEREYLEKDVAIALAAQRAQDAQTGYCSDYCSKNQPMGVHEIKEFQKGHLALHATLKGESLERIGKRHANRFLSDAYCKGLVRGQVECYQNTKFVKTQPAPGSGARHLREAVEAQAYGHRPSESECWWLSPYEFVMYWKLVPTKVPYSRAEWEAAPQDGWDAPARLKPGMHYVIQIPPTCDRLLFPPGGPTQTLRHNWYLERRVRPRCPHFASAPVPKGFAENAEHNAKLTSVYFRAWTLDVNSATSTVPYLGHLRGEEDSWESSLRAWLLRLPSAETKRHVGNFLSVYRVRPAADADNNSDDDDVDEPFHLQPADIATALRTLLPARNNKASKTSNDHRCEQMEAALTQALEESPASEEAVSAWLANLDSNGRCNSEQRSFCEKVAGRVLTELEENRFEPNQSSSQAEPLRWVLHGGPGTGKSHTLKLLRTELFENVLGWQHGVEFQIVSFQAVMAELLNGDTIHHALGLDWSGDRTQNLPRTLERARQALQWRWLILDEFSMVSAELLAQLELRCRELMRDLSIAKYGQHDGRVRPFGGLNIILAGDLYQLPPPKGTFLADIPWDLLAGRKASKQATGHQGQTLLWGGSAAGMQGVTELLQCERTRDSWLTEVQDELRHGRLSNDNHAFLHGRPTTVPGSWTAGAVACGKESCAALVSKKETPEQILQHECATCSHDRASRELVARGSADPRFHAEFANAVSIFGTNDIKYHVNKVRAVQWATSRGKQVQLAVARDKASATVLQEKPDLAAEKLQWLQRHDKECGELYGMLPLCVGMPVRATDHLDRKRRTGCPAATFLLPNVAFETRLKYKAGGWKTLVSQGFSPTLLKDKLGTQAGATFLLPNVAFETRLKYQVEGWKTLVVGGWKTLVSQGFSPTLLNDELGATFVLPNVAFETRLKYQAGVERDRALRALRSEHGDLNSAMLRATAEMENSNAPEAEVPETAPPPPAPMQRLGGFFQEMSQQAQHMTQLGASRLQGIHLGPRPPEEAAPSAPPAPRPPQMQLLGMRSETSTGR
eukprot:s774_g16.t1